MKLTGYLKLEKPEDSDVTAQDSFNTNFDKLDKELAKVSDFDSVKNSTKHIKGGVIPLSDWKKVGEYYKAIWKHPDITVNTQVNVNFHLESLYNARYVVAVRVGKQGEAELFARSKPESALRCDMTLLTEVK